MGFKAGVIRGTVLINDTLTGNTNIGATSNSGTISIGNTSSGAVNIDCGTAGINVGTTANAHVTTVGSTNTSSGLTLQYGTSDFSLASATGTVMSALDTGEITYPLQPAFLAYNSVDDANQTGAGTTATVNFDGVIFDQNSDYDGTNTFTAPVSGKYQFYGLVRLLNIDALADDAFVTLSSSNRDIFSGNGGGNTRNVSNQTSLSYASILDMDAGDTCVFQVTVSDMVADTVTIQGIAGGTSITTCFSGSLLV